VNINTGEKESDGSGRVWGEIQGRGSFKRERDDEGDRERTEMKKRQDDASSREKGVSKRKKDLRPKQSRRGKKMAGQIGSAQNDYL